MCVRSSDEVEQSGEVSVIGEATKLFKTRCGGCIEFSILCASVVMDGTGAAVVVVMMEGTGGCTVVV